MDTQIDHGLNEYPACKRAYEKAQELLKQENPDKKELSDLLGTFNKNPGGVKWLKTELGDEYSRAYGKLCIAAGMRDFNVKIRPLVSHFEISNVHIRDEYYNIHLCRQPLDGKEMHTHEEWREIEVKTGWRLPDPKMYHAIMRAAVYGSMHYDDEQRAGFLSLKEMLIADFKSGPMMTSAKVSNAISLQCILSDKMGFGGMCIYGRDEMVCLLHKESGLLFHGDDYDISLQKLLCADIEEAASIYRQFAGIHRGSDGIEWPVVLGLTLPSKSGIITVGYQSRCDEGGPFILFNVNATNTDDAEARARGIRFVLKG